MHLDQGRIERLAGLTGAQWDDPELVEAAYQRLLRDVRDRSLAIAALRAVLQSFEEADE